MTTKEFSNTFDILLNSNDTRALYGDVSSIGDMVLDEYEKSILLTQAQDIIVKSYFDRQLNQQGQGFDDSSKRQIDFSNLITTGVASLNEDTTKVPYDSRGKLFKMPSNILLILNELLTVTTDGVDSNYVVVPVHYKEYDRMMSRPYTQPLKKQCWRLYQGVGNSESTESTKVDLLSEVITSEGSISANSSLKYKIRYIRRPRPIILTNLKFISSPGELTIDNKTDISECELNPLIHMDILNKAIEIAYTTRGKRAIQQPQQPQQQEQQTQ